jgi:spore coat protein H
MKDRLLAWIVVGQWFVLAGCNPPLAPVAPAPADSRASAPAAAVVASPPRARIRDDSDAFFEDASIPELRLQIAPAEADKLRAENRTYVECSLVEQGGEPVERVGIKLKGAAGSFRDLDDKPALTLNVGKFKKKQLFHGLSKFHLNNSVQDETYLNELLCSEIFLKANVAATRVKHARVWLNDRDLGLYVLKEGFDKPFLKRHFDDPDGNLYDGGFCTDIDTDLELDSGSGSDNRSDLRELLDACRDPDAEARAARVAKLVDVPAFLTFVALELMTGHWDGYSQKANNYRLYFDPTRKQASFLPHGMDQMFGDPGASILEYPPAIVAAAVMGNPRWREAYRRRIGELLPLFSPPEQLLARIDEVAPRLQSALAAIDPALGENHSGLVRELKERIVARAANLEEQNHAPDPGPPEPPRPLEFDEQGEAALADWHPAAESEDAALEFVEGAETGPVYTVVCGPSGQCIASWRRGVQLERGDYKLKVRARANEISALTDEKGTGAGIRISGGMRTNRLSGTADWQTLEYEFSVEEDLRDVELVAELRATHGQVWFAADSFRLIRKLQAPPAENR